MMDYIVACAYKVSNPCRINRSFIQYHVEMEITLFFICQAHTWHKYFVYSDTLCLARIHTINAALVCVCTHIMHRHVPAYITQTETEREREREREKATLHLSITLGHSRTLLHHSITDYRSACAGWLKWSEGYFVLKRQTMRHSPAWRSLGEG